MELQWIIRGIIRLVHDLHHNDTILVLESARHCIAEINQGAVSYFGNSIKFMTFIVSRHALLLRFEGIR